MKYCGHEFSLRLSIVTFWFCNYNNFAFFSDLAVVVATTISLSLSLSLIIATLSLYYSHFNILNLSVSLLVERNRIMYLHFFL